MTSYFFSADKIKLIAFNSVAMKISAAS